MKKLLLILLLGAATALHSPAQATVPLPTLKSTQLAAIVTASGVTLPTAQSVATIRYLNVFWQPSATGSTIQLSIRFSGGSPVESTYTITQAQLTSAIAAGAALPSGESAANVSHLGVFVLPNGVIHESLQFAK